MERIANKEATTQPALIYTIAWTILVRQFAIDAVRNALATKMVTPHS
jgi:hypothetical protein